ncbi:MAG: monomeric [FeFe] hydrogenase, partial [Clostridia bacterium]|nr:monomeric [FeFe] hydrogenase [Clostridia bacterium]
DTIQVVDIACDECPRSGYIVTDMCRGCLAHNCQESCLRGAIAIDYKGRSHIDKTKCVECGRCANACKYGAIVNMVRPCEKVCPTGAIHMGEDGAAEIDQNKCIVCGQCVFDCPFGAPSDISDIVKVIKAIQQYNGPKVYAIVAPAVAGQFPEGTTEQVYTAIRTIGFDEVVEVAEGADITARIEAEELLEKGFITTSCCPAFVEYITVKFPELVPHVSSTLSPMAYTAMKIKEKDPEAIVVFIGPCMAKKYEKKQEKTAGNINYVLTFSELQALFDSKDIDISTLPETHLQDGSSFARKYCMSGGVAASVAQALKEMGREDFEVKPVICNGIDECKQALLKAKAGKLDGNIIEGMCCPGGCIRGNGTLINKKNFNKCAEEYADSAEKKTILGE